MINDHELVNSMDEFLASVEKRAFIMARSSTGDREAALDIVQDCMFRMVRYYSDKPFEQWLPLFYRILNNRITDHHRKRGWNRLKQWFGNGNEEDAGTSPDVMEQIPVNTPGPEERIEDVQFGKKLQIALEQLSERQRQAFLLRQWQGLSVSETASAMGVSEGSVKTHLWRAVQSLRDSLQEYDFQ